MFAVRLLTRGKSGVLHKDGFYRLFLAANDCPRLSIILPLYPEEEQLVAIPLACTMGWTQSPPSFCTMSETVTNLINARLRTKPALPVPSHRLSSLAASHDDVASWARAREPRSAGSRHLSNTAYKLPITHADVFVDDFILLGQGGPARLTWMQDHLLHAVDDILDTHLPTEPRNEAVSVKKLRNGDGGWATCNTPLLLRVKSRTANNCASLSGRHTAVHVS